MRDERNIREEVYLSIVEQFKAEIMELDKEMERLEKEKVRLQILRDLQINKDLHKPQEHMSIEEIERKQAKIEKEIDDKQITLSKLEQIKKNYLK